MLKFRLETTDEYERLVKFFIENGLEFTNEDLEEVDTDIVHIWKMVHTGDTLVGGVVLAKREGKYIIDGIAVEKIFRKFGLGKIMVNKVISEVKKLGGDSIYLVARAPEFFKTLGFCEIKEEDAPNFFECKTCPQFNVSCNPKIMMYSLNK